ncbi:GTPase-activating protein GYP7 [Rhodotorula paludigena]|uniref:GTPase-activating protein GYP7 n=1 Tax=Rhodotorula paludigena TaxID=86838 RepID=UPI00318051C8
MGGGPQTPPSPSQLANVVSRSTDDLVEVSVQPSDSTKASGTTSSAPRDPLAVEASSASGTSTATSSASLAGTTRAVAGMGLTEEPDAGELAELLWSKSAVYLHPSPHARDNLPGFLSVVRVRQDGGTGDGEQGTGGAARWKHLVSWIPEKLVEGTRDFDAYVLVELSSQNERDILVHLAPPVESSSSHPDLHSPRAHAFSHPISSLYSIHVQPPTLTSWVGTLTLSLFGGITLPPLHFHDDESQSTLLDREQRASPARPSSTLAPGWGGESFLAALKPYALLVRSQLDPSVYLVNPSREDLDAHAPARAYAGDAEDAGLEAATRDQRGSAPQNRARTSILHQSSPATGRARASRQQPKEVEWPDDPDAVLLGDRGSQGQGGMDPLTFSVLSGFSRLTRNARQFSQQAASTVLSHPLAKPLAKHVPKPIAQFALAPGEVSRLTDAAGVGTYDSARVYLAKWARIVAEEGERARKAEYGVDDAGFLEDELGGEQGGMWEVLSKTYRIEGRPRSTRAPRTPIQLEEWGAWFEQDEGRLLLDEAEAKRRIFQRGLADDEVRKQVWPFLLKVYPWTSTAAERSKIVDAKSSEYEAAKRRWMDNEALQKTERFLEEDHRVEIDCRRTDRTHPLFASDLPAGVDPSAGAHPPSNAHVRAAHDVLMTWVFAADPPTPPATPAVEPAPAPEPPSPSPPTSSASPLDPPRNYVQGMSDLFSPLYVVVDGEQWLAYACFDEVMRRQADNFREDQSGMKRQLSQLQALIRTIDRGLYRHLDETGSLNLFFCFRWLLTSFKRELSFDDTVRLWEVLWTEHLGSHFHLFFALAILEANRDVVIRYLREFDEILKYINELSQTLDLASLLAEAETLYYTFRAICDACAPAPAPAASGEDGGLRQRKFAPSPAAQGHKVGNFPPTSEDAEEVRRERVRKRTAREIGELRELLE